jgi:hypothetical protein
MPEDRESLGWKLFMQEMEIRVSALEADAEKIKRDVEAYVAKRTKVRRIFGRLLKS